MGRLRSLIACPAVLALLGLGTGCAGGGFWKNRPTTLPTELTGGPNGRAESNAVVPAGGVSPLAQVPSSLAWLTGKSDRSPKGAATTLVAAWQNHIDYLPDPTRDGAMGPGLAGQLFVFDQYDQPALLNGSITVDLYDETKRPPGAQPNKPERWKFNKDVVKALRSVDERFGPNYVLFLPWPTYRPDMTRVRITVLYDPENGSFPIRALESRLTLDPTLAGAAETGASATPPKKLPTDLGTTTGGGAATMTAPANTGSSGGPGMGVIRMNGPRSASGPMSESNAGIISSTRP
jgi:hypothetical protein